MTFLRHLIRVLVPIAVLVVAARGQEVPLRIATLKVVNSSGVADLKFEVGRLEKVTLEAPFMSPSNDDLKLITATPENLKLGPLNTGSTPELRLEIRPAAVQGTVLRFRINTQEGGQVHLAITGQDEIVVPGGQDQVFTIFVEAQP